MDIFCSVVNCIVKAERPTLDVAPTTLLLVLLGPFHGAIAVPCLSRVVVVVVVDIDAQAARDSTASDTW